MNAQVRTPQLRGLPVKAIQRRIKVFVYGSAGSGKSFFCTHFPKPYYIDTERGAERSKYIENISANGGVVFQTRNFADIYQEVKILATVKHDFQTLVIDPITPIYNNLLDECLGRLKGKAGYGQHYQEAGKQFQKLIDLLLTIDMNVVLTAHVKDKYGSDMNVIGTTYDAYKKIDFLFDIVIETVTRGNNYLGISRKSRIISLEPNQEFNFSFAEFSKMYKKELEHFEPMPIKAEHEEGKPVSIIKPIKPAVEEIERIATSDGGSVSPETKNHLKFLVAHCQIPQDTVNKWFKKANITKFEDFSEEQAIKAIEHLEASDREAKQAWIDFVKARETYSQEQAEGVAVNE